jgi:hypothetical protein
MQGDCPIRLRRLLRALLQLFADSYFPEIVSSQARAVNEALVRELASGAFLAFLAQQPNTVVIDGTGTGKTHLRRWEPLL